jgi:two-component system sensor histidine kinase TctE
MAFESLRSQLLFWLLAPLALVAALDTVVTYRSAGETATIVQERMLLGAARVIGEQVHLEDGTVQVVIPPAALELFASPSADRVYYRVSGNDGRLLSGYYDLPLPPHAPGNEESLYFDTVQRGQPIRAVAFAQPVFTAPNRGPILIEVGQTLAGHDELARTIWLAAMGRQLALLVLVGLLLWFGLRRGIRPLLELRDRMLERRAGSLDRLDARRTPTELRPLVAAVNDYVERLDRHMSDHSRFIADASHQLRTPLTLLNTQVVYALRHDDPATRGEVLQAIHRSVQHSMRLVQQLLSFALAEASASAPASQGRADLVATVQRVLEALASIAVQRNIDLGFEHEAGLAEVALKPQLLHELVANLVDNALRYTQPGGVVTVRVAAAAGEVVLTLADNGPGIPAQLRDKVFERFYRLHDDHSDGCGLGLAIVREIAAVAGARVVLDHGPGGSGLLVTVRFAGLQGAPDQRGGLTNSVL